MKRVFPWLAFFVVTLLVACSGNKNTDKKDNARVLMENTTDSQGLQRMQVSNAEQTVELKGKKYQLSLVRMPDDNLPLVESEVGDTFVDNKITLKITQEGRQIYNKTFTKQDFSSIVGSRFLQKSILEGMVFDKTTSQGLVFAVSVSYPQTDLFFPISVTISSDGKMSMKKEELIEELYFPAD